MSFCLGPTEGPGTDRRAACTGKDKAGRIVPSVWFGGGVSVTGQKMASCSSPASYRRADVRTEVAGVDWKIRVDGRYPDYCGSQPLKIFF